MKILFLVDNLRSYFYKVLEEREKIGFVYKHHGKSNTFITTPWNNREYIVIFFIVNNKFRIESWYTA